MAAFATRPPSRSKSDIYRDALPLLNSGRIMLPKNDRLFNQLVSLERHVARGGHDVIDHPSGQHDDVANAAMGAAVLAAAVGGYNLELLPQATALGRRGRLRDQPGGPRSGLSQPTCAAHLRSSAAAQCWPR